MKKITENGGFEQTIRSRACVAQRTHNRRACGMEKPTGIPDRPIVQTADGRVRGKTKHTEAGKVYYSFQGIPYAKPPIGPLRFQAPQPAEPWSGVRDAGSEGNMCPQPKTNVKILPTSFGLRDLGAYVRNVPGLCKRGLKFWQQSEDCLYLNVYTPELPQENVEEKAVLVWIHGGGFVVGDSGADIFGPDHFLHKNIVVVTLNYRLGPFGFLSVGTDAAPGNAGLKDQILALQWVRANIGAFGGDRNNITVFGESAGATCAHMHTLSPRGKGLFNRIIAASGSAAHEWAMAEQPLRWAQELGRLLNIDTDDPDKLVAALRDQTASDLVEATCRLRAEGRYVACELAFLPVVEHWHPDAYLWEHPIDILERKGQAPVPIMMGANNREGLLWCSGNPTSDRKNPMSREAMEKLNQRLECQPFITNEAYTALTLEQREECHDEIMEYYFNNERLSTASIDKFIDLFGDICFINPLYSVSKMHAANEASPVYVYYITFDGQQAFFKRLMGLTKYKADVSHGDELAYLFRVRILPRVPESEEDREHRARLLQLWSNFIVTGNPTPDSRPCLGVMWTPAWQRGQMNFLEFGRALKLHLSEPVNARVNFWDGLYRKYLKRQLLSGEPFQKALESPSADLE